MPDQVALAIPRLDLGAAFMEYITTQVVFAGLQVLPILPTPKKASHFAKITRASFLKPVDSKRAPRAGYNEADLYISDGEYACEEDGLKGLLDDGDRELYRTSFDAEKAKILQIGHLLMLNQDRDIAAMVFDPTVSWPTTDADLYTDVSGAPWDAAASDAIGHVLAANLKVRRNCGLKPNALVVGHVTLVNLLQNTGIIARFPGAPRVTAQMLRDSMAAIFDLDKLIVGESVYDSAKETSPHAGTDVWSEGYALVCRVAEPGSDVTTPGVGRTWLWTEDSPTNAVVEQYRDEEHRSDAFRVRRHTKSMIFDPGFGHLLKVD